MALFDIGEPAQEHIPFSEARARTGAVAEESVKEEDEAQAGHDCSKIRRFRALLAVTMSASMIISGEMVMASIDVEVTMAFSDVEVS